MVKNRLWLGVALACAVGCSAEEIRPDSLLDYGDAEWSRPPFDPPGGNGENNDGGGGYDSGAGSSAGGTGGNAPDTGYDASGAWESSSSGEPESDTEGPADTDTDTDTDTDGVKDRGGPGGDLIDKPAARPAEGDLICPDTKDDVVLYMSNDDSNSQASPILARRTVADGQVVDPFRVRIHEFLNYYDLSYDNPKDEAVRVGMQMRRINKETGEFVLLLYAQGRQIDPASRPAMNLVFSLDTSGSMSGEPIELLKESMRAVAGVLQAGDIVSLVEWSSDQAVPLEGLAVDGPNDPALLEVIEGLAADGSTDLHGGLVRAYDLANDYYGPDRLNRVVLISDGGANTGVTDIDLIAAEANDRDGEGIYLVGVGVGSAGSYDDTLMDELTDAGKGAYIFIDKPEEAHRMFKERFVQNVMVAARNVQMQLTLPWYFGIKEFHGEEYSADPAEVDPQHLSPNDAMSYHQIIQSCDPGQIFRGDKIKARATYEDPITLEPARSELELTMGDIVRRSADQLYKGDVVVAYAQSFIVIGDLHRNGDHAAAQEVAIEMVDWLAEAETTLADAEIGEMRAIMQTYVTVLGG